MRTEIHWNVFKSPDHLISAVTACDCATPTLRPNSPIIVIHGNQIENVPNHYVRYLGETFRQALDLHGTPIRIEFKVAKIPTPTKIYKNRA